MRTETRLKREEGSHPDTPDNTKHTDEGSERGGRQEEREGRMRRRNGKMSEEKNSYNLTGTLLGALCSNNKL